MSLIRSRALAPFFDDFLSRDWFDWKNNHFSETNTTIPSVNILEKPDSFVVEMVAPGMKKKDFKVELNDNTLLIYGKNHQYVGPREGEKYTRQEFSYQSFQRTFHLHKDVVELEKIEAKYADGILRLMIPKTETAKTKPPRYIEIN